MTSINARSVPALLVALLPVTACYSPNSPSGTSADDAGEGDSTSQATTSGNGPADTTATTTTTEADSSGADDSTTHDEPVCGDALVEGDEVCDDGINDGSYDGCLADCTELGPHCGDGVEQADEACDDGDDVNGDGCNIDCVVSGTVLWSHTVDGTEHLSDSACAVAIDDEDAIYAVGVVDQSASAWIRRYDSGGAEDWTEMFAAPSNDETGCSKAVWGGASELHVVGTHDASSLGNARDAWLRRYTSAGTLQGDFTWDNPANSDDRGSGVAVNDDGQMFVLGNSSRFDLGQGWNIWLRKLDADGEEMWTQPYDTGDSEFAGGVAIDGEGNAIAVGWVETESEGDNIWLRKYSPEGMTLWTKNYNSPDDCSDQGADVSTDGDDNVLITGTTCGDVLVRKYTSDGSVEWTDVYDGPGALFDFGSGIAADTQGDVIVVGVQSFDPHQEALVRKYASAGQELWTYSYPSDDDGSLWSSAAAVAVDSADAVVAVGLVNDHAGDPADIWVQKFAP